MGPPPEGMIRPPVSPLSSRRYPARVLHADLVAGQPAIEQDQPALLEGSEFVSMAVYHHDWLQLAACPAKKAADGQRVQRQRHAAIVASQKNVWPLDLAARSPCGRSLTVHHRRYMDARP